MLLFFQVLCAYFAAVGLFFLIREAYYSLCEDKNGNCICIYIAREGESESDARRMLENGDMGGRVYVIYGDDRQTEKEITDLCIRYGRIYIKK